MSIDFQERLRTDMGHVEVHPRPGLVREAHRRYQRGRRRNALAVAATGTAAAVAGAAAGFALTAGTSGTAAPIETTAYVVSHVSSALAATDAIGYSTARFTGADAIGFLADRTVDWEFGDLSRELFESRTGQPLHDISNRPSGGAWAEIVVQYPERDWARITIAKLFRPGASDLCDGDVLGLLGLGLRTAADWKDIIESGLTCGAFTVDGRQRVDGVDAIKLTGRKTATGTTIWVSPHSYLPVRLTERARADRTGPIRGSTGTLTVDFRWLAPTRANLAKLTAPIPAGFHKVKYP